MSRHNVRFSKGLGQNFIINPDLCPEIARLGGADSGVGALEIGPGIGVLTVQLARLCAKVVAIEIDRSLIPVLSETMSGFSNIKILSADAMKIDLHSLILNEFAGVDVIVCANLPYYITSPIIMHLLESRLPVKSITVMVQKEAAQRICAPMPSRLSGAITAAVRYYSNPQLLFEVSRNDFLPSPNVDSAVIRLDIRSYPPVKVDDEAMFFRVVKGAFAQRRKTALNSLSAHFGIDKRSFAEIMLKSNIEPQSRAEEFSLENFASIARILSSNSPFTIAEDGVSSPQ